VPPELHDPRAHPVHHRRGSGGLYAPFDVEVTADRAVYYAWGSNRVKANVVDKVVLSGKLMSCGVAVMKTYSQVGNNVWASCDCHNVTYA
jgi:hypothetical protein